MTIEIRQMLIKSTVGANGGEERVPGSPALDPEEIESLKREVMAECMERLAEKMRAAQER